VAGLGHNAIGLMQETEVPHLYSLYSFLPADCVIMVYVNKVSLSGFGGLELACWPLVPKFAGSHPAEAVGFLD
jgi:hypothetical protein